MKSVSDFDVAHWIHMTQSGNSDVSCEYDTEPSGFKREEFID
jgi:hypothetical protein